MRYLPFLLCALTGLAGCADHDLRIAYGDSSAGCVPGDFSVPHDMSTASTCAAAKGLSGVPIICTDFPSPQTLVDLKGMGWDFTQCVAGWTVSNSNLQVNSFSTFASSCSFTTRPLTPSEYQKYSSFTLSVVQMVDLNDQQQTAQIFMGLDVSKRQVAASTGTNPRQRNTYEIAKPALPNGGTNNYQPLFKITSGTMVGTSNIGWQIESIAVLGNP